MPTQPAPQLLVLASSNLPCSDRLHALRVCYARHPGYLARSIIYDSAGGAEGQSYLGGLHRSVYAVRALRLQCFVQALPLSPGFVLRVCRLQYLVHALKQQCATHGVSHATTPACLPGIAVSAGAHTGRHGDVCDILATGPVL